MVQSASHIHNTVSNWDFIHDMSVCCEIFQIWLHL